MTIEAACDFGHLTLQDPAHRESHPPIGQFLDTDEFTGTETEGVAALQNLVEVVAGPFPGDAGDVFHEGQAGGLTLLHRPRHFDPDSMAVRRLQVRPVPVHERIELVSQHRGQYDLRVFLEEARVVLLVEKVARRLRISLFVGHRHTNVANFPDYSIGRLQEKAYIRGNVPKQS